MLSYHSTGDLHSGILKVSGNKNGRAPSETARGHLFTSPCCALPAPSPAAPGGRGGWRERAPVRPWAVGPGPCGTRPRPSTRSEEHTSELQSRFDLVCRLLLEKKKTH